MKSLNEKKQGFTPTPVNTTKILASLTERLTGQKNNLDNLHQRQASIDTQIKVCFSKLEQAGLPTRPSTSNHCTVACRRLMIKSAVYSADQEATIIETCKQTKKELSHWHRKTNARFAYNLLDGEYKTNLLSRIEKENFEREKTIVQLRIRN